MVVFIMAYLAALLLTALTVGPAVSLARASRQRHHQVFVFLVIVNDAVCLSEALLKAFPARPGSMAAEASLVSGFVAFPLMAIFSYLLLDWFLALAGTRVPRALKWTCAVFWGLLFLGFLVAEFRYLNDRDLRLERLLKPLFNGAIAATGMGAASFALWRVRALADPGERRFVRRLAVHVAVAFVAIGLLFFVHLPMNPRWQILARAFLGLVYLLPPLLWMRRRFLETRIAPLTRVAGDGEALGHWLETRDLSPRERQIVRCVIEGKPNAAIGEELFISFRTVESHLYSIYRKLGVKNRLQLARLAAIESAKESEQAAGVPTN